MNRHFVDYSEFKCGWLYIYIYISHHKHQELGRLARSVSTVTAALSSVSSVYQPFSFLVGCSGMISKGFGFVAFFEGVKASSFYMHLSCPVYVQCAVRGVWSRLFRKRTRLEALRVATTKLSQRGTGYPSWGHYTQLRISRGSAGLIYIYIVWHAIPLWVY
jgi:hypothetical protein